MRIRIPNVLMTFVLAASACTTTQDLAKNRSMFDHDCDQKDLIIGPVEAHETAIKGTGTTYSVVCQQSGNKWKALYRCDHHFFQPTSCTEIKGETAK